MLLNPITLELASFTQREVPHAVRQRAALHVMDWLGCAIFGLRASAGKIIAAHTREGADGKCSAIGEADKKHLDSAAFHNGCLGNLGEMDDVHRSSILHPGPVVIPAALAVAEHVNASGPQLLDAIVHGYEAMIRIGQYVGAAHYQFFHNTSTVGSFGAAAAAASLLKLDMDSFADALGNAGTRTGGLWQMRHEPCMSKSLHIGLAVQSGVLAAMLAKRGFTGPKHILEGPQGFFKAMAPDGSPIEIIYEPDAPFRILDVSFKPWPACRHVHAAIDAALLLKADLPKADLQGNHAIKAVLVESYADAIKFCDNADPQDEAQAKFSLQHAVAVALSKLKPGFDDFVPPFNLERINQLRARIRVRASEEFTRAYPNQYGARVTVMLNDNSKHSTTVRDAWGDPAWPLTLAELEAKFSQLLTKVGVEARLAHELMVCVKQLPTADSITELATRMRRVQAA